MAPKVHLPSLDPDPRVREGIELIEDVTRAFLRLDLSRRGLQAAVPGTDRVDTCLRSVATEARNLAAVLDRIVEHRQRLGKIEEESRA